VLNRANKRLTEQNYAL